jgi:hypothetical protein
MGKNCSHKNLIFLFNVTVSRRKESNKRCSEVGKGMMD